MLGIVFERKCPINDLDTPICNLTGDKKRFYEVKLVTVDDEVIIFTTNAKNHKANRQLCKESIYGTEILIELHSEHLTWIEHGKLNILPYSMICRWVIE